MSKVVLDVSMSLDGFVAGPNVREAEPMGDGGERLHVWMAGKGPDTRDRHERAPRSGRDFGATSSDGARSILGVGPWGRTPWPGIPSFVVTHRASRTCSATTAGCFP